MEKKIISGYKKRLKIRSKFFFLLLVFQLLVFIPLILNIDEAIAVSGGNPGERTGHQMIYDPILDEIVLYGGNRGNGDHSSLDTVWKYSISNSEWVEIKISVFPSLSFCSISFFFAAVNLESISILTGKFLNRSLKTK